MSFDQGDLVDRALQEDIPTSDITTDGLGVKTRIGVARLIAKEDLVLSGSTLFDLTFKKIDAENKISWGFKDGDLCLKNQTLATIKGNQVTMLKSERVALNFLGHLSGVASLTRCFVNEVSGTKTQITDTRKTLPGMRSFQKQAVVHGGGVNHRMSLSDRVLIKENHIQIAGDIQSAIKTIKSQTKEHLTVEVKNLDEVKAAIELKVDRILLDNMSSEEMRAAVKIIPGFIETEASGNMTLDRVKSVAQIGVNYISVGALTHSAPCADISLLLESPNKAEPS